ncbi:MAG: ribose-5-phosphate isomerase A [Nitrospirales bacterium]|nr:MAG: ribose-5-phosphate isomerase A [Nitrospirales bacterium]
MKPETWNLKKAAAEKSLECIHDGNTVGLGTGSTVRYLLEALAPRVQEGLRIQGVPTSQETALMASQLHIPILQDEDYWSVDVAIDGADEVDPQLNLIKGGGGALLREKIIAANAKQFVVIVDDGKLVSSLGVAFPLPVEVTPFGWPSTVRAIEQLGYRATRRERNGQAFVTDNQHYILDLHGPAIANPSRLAQQLHDIPGVVESGLFVGMTSTLIVGTPQGVVVHRPPSRV